MGSRIDPEVARLEALIGSTDEIVFEFDEGGTYLNTWTANDDLLVLPREELLGHKIGELLGEESARSFERATREAMSTGRPVSFDATLDLPDGTHWFQYRLFRIPATEGHRATFGVLARDVSERVVSERALRDSEERYRTLVEQLPAVTYIEVPTDDPTSSTLVYVSPQVEKILGFSPERFLDLPRFWLERVHPDDRGMVVEANARSEQTGEPFEAVYRMLASDDRVVWFDSRAMLIRDREGCPRFWHGVAMDVTDRVEAQRALAETEMRYRGLVEKVPAIIYIETLDPHPDEAHFVYLSPNIENILGFTAEEYSRDPGFWIERMHPDDREAALEASARSLETGADFVAQYRIFARDGRTVWFDSRSTLVRDEEGRPALWHGVAIDITEQKAVEQARREAEERYRVVVENTYDLVTLADRDGRVVYASPSHRAVLGVDPDGLVGRSVHELVAPPDAEGSERAFEAALRGEPARSARFLMTGADGRWVVVETSGFQPVASEDGSTRLVLRIARDVTEQVAVERERSQLLSEIVAAQEQERARIAQDLHDDPVQAVAAAGFHVAAVADSIEDDATRERLRAIVDSIEQTVVRMRHLMFELWPPALEGLGLAGAIEEYLWREFGDSLEFEVRSSLDREPPMPIRIVAYRVVQEALVNVRKHVDASKVLVILEADDRHLSIRVEDDGAGWSRRAPSDPTHLGIRSMRQRAELAHGELRILPRSPRGTIVSFRLPSG
jgi:PAS domain S-box-containing protein